jgi:hypothetical protein
MAYIGSTPTTQSFISGTDYFNGTGSQTSFTLSRPVGSVNDIQAVVNNVVQVPNDAYNVSGTSIVFTSAPSAGTGNVYVRYLSTTTQSITPSQNTVSYATLNTDLQSGGYASNFKNRLINGAMVISQRGTSFSSSSVTNGDYQLDRWYAWCNNGSANATVVQSSTAPAGFINSFLFTNVTAVTVGSADRAQLTQAIEGLNITDLGWGTANAQPVTLSFWVRCSLTGQFGGSVQNNATNRSYPFIYTISAANTYEYKTITIPGDTTGTWLTTNAIGIQLNFDLGCGSTLKGTAGTWAATNYRGATGDVNLTANAGATFYITGVQLEKGSTATSFDYRPYGTELQLAQRYYIAETLTGNHTFWIPSSTDSYRYFTYGYKATMRASPTVTGIYGGSAGTVVVGSTPASFYMYVNFGNSTSYKVVESYTAYAEL